MFTLYIHIHTHTHIYIQVRNHDTLYLTSLMKYGDAANGVQKVEQSHSMILNGTFHSTTSKKKAIHIRSGFDVSIGADI